VDTRLGIGHSRGWRQSQLITRTDGRMAGRMAKIDHGFRFVRGDFVLMKSGDNTQH
jgi:hypothetical protein